MFKDKIDFWFDEVKKVMTEIIGTKARGVDEWKDIWMSQKGDLLPYFDDNGRIEKEIKLENLTKEDKQDMVNSVFNSSQGITNTVYNRIGNVSLSIEIVDALCEDLKRVSASEICENRLEENRYGFNKGTKVSKYLSATRKDYLKYIKVLDEDYVNMYMENYNIAFSMGINSLKSRGKVGLSINPMDFIMVSSHTNGWKSCHNIYDGCYRTGGVSYMLDMASIVGYGYEKTTPLSESGFNSTVKMPLKTWRAMVFLDPDTRNYGIISRQYPSEKSIYSYTVRELTAELMGTICNVPSNYVVSTYNRSPIKKTELLDKYHEARIIADRAYNYFDPISSHVLLSNFKDSADRKLLISVGSSAIPCTECGCLRYYDEEDEGANYLNCENCDNRGRYCYSCGDPCSGDYSYQGDAYCASCYNRNFSYCAHCDDAFYHNDLWGATDSLGRRLRVCEYCRDEYYTECDRCGEYHENVQHVEVNGYIREWCISCVEDSACSCANCEKVTSSSVEVERNYYCIDCAQSLFKQCSICGEYTSETTEVSDLHYCDGCLHRYCKKCEECGKYTTDSIFNLCENCVKNREKAVV